MRVVAGLGNPGPRYAETRHNVGFRVVEQLAAAAGGSWSAGQAVAVALLQEAGQEVALAKPLIYMNRSGDALVALRRDLWFEPGELLVVVDDFLLDFGRVRLRRGGSDGGHNGLASVLARLQTPAVPRLRLGIGPVPAGGDDIDFVLSPFAVGEDVEGLVARGCAAARCWLTEGIEVAMNRFNGCPGL